MLTDEASRLEKMCGMDASGECGRRPDRRSCAEWTPCNLASGVQIKIGVQNGRRVIVRMASRLEKMCGMDAM